ncbi:uronate isomerase [Anaerocolumna cellulosilytica]|uniref:Uronate isomerase n=1 Tax=Anaerocolumna cellulosilytica TaxID=433286 RepID=A0A6S6R146_9FIRM|nr:glucuronate isomerase [Anaerocolumna cellulosilytica]MBB5194329.1 glucuronate isomerase [Anaerocolumna cellulosilytica]BCJ93272.1 uronate isomerase [Anaerocolumna cellulosilytica]
MDANQFQEELFLTNQTGSRLYHKYAEDLPILDYHCHLLPQEIYENREFEDLGEMWLAHDHYKWRAMRAFGIEEEYITGSAAYYDKFLKFAGLLPKLAGNPIYIWCALELKRYFGISKPLTSENAEEIYRSTKRLIKEQHMTPRWCMETSRVEFVCTTEDPVDNLTYHKRMKEDNSLNVKIVSAFRPDKAFYCEKEVYLEYIQQLAGASAITIGSFEELLHALEIRLLYFKELGSTISDHGIESFVWQDYSFTEVEQIFAKILKKKVLTDTEINCYKSAFLAGLGSLYDKHGFVMQLHIGTYQGANKTGERHIGVACGFDCTDDTTSIQAVGGLLNHLTEKGQLPKTIVYPLNSAQIETFAILAAGFCEGGTKAKVQLGAPWWFNDQAYGINRQFEAIANLYPLSLSVGMLTDSRSFLSYPRHELYRRVLCDYLGRLVERGEYISEEKYLQEMIEDICYNNAKEYFMI